MGKNTGNEDLACVLIEELHDMKYVCPEHFQSKDLNKKKSRLKKWTVFLKNKMEFNWFKKSPNLVKGVQVINQIEVTKFEQLLNRIVMKMNIQDSEIFTNEEIKKLEKIFKIDEENLLLSIKILLYLLKKSLKLIFMPANLKVDLKSIGMESDKCEIFVKLWSSETRSLLNELGSETTERQRHNFDIMWKVNAELSSDYHKKCKIPKAYFSFSRNKDETDIELTHQELYSIFLQFESIQNELDNLV